ncbi:MAG TPA: type II toxin-antitoxin system ParD family antitoxin [Gemmataceae bacterium]|nr:type II toxin-antitoxin system ParD family antitoxin [Gemmataceae bacterium]
MKISLTRELEQFVARKVASGSFRNASEVIREGLRVLREREKARKDAVDELRRQILVGIQQADGGKTSPFNDATLRRIKTRGRQRRNSNGSTRE